MKTNKIAIIVIFVLIILSITTIYIRGFKYELPYTNNLKIELNMEKIYDVNDIKQISKEVFDKQEFFIQTDKISGNNIIITTESMTEEQQSNFINKINEKYTTEYTIEDLKIYNTGSTNIVSLASNYIKMMVISAVLVLVYFYIKYKKKGILKIFGISIISFIAIQLLFFGVLSLIQTPVSMITLSISMVIFVITTYIVTSEIEKV